MNNANCTQPLMSGGNREDRRRSREIARSHKRFPEEYLFNFPAVKPVGRAGKAMGKGNFLSSYSKQRKRQKGCWRLEGPTSLRAEIRVEKLHKNELNENLSLKHVATSDFSQEFC